jgi:hypothetical protein
LPVALIGAPRSIQRANIIFSSSDSGGTLIQESGTSDR